MNTPHEEYSIRSLDKSLNSFFYFYIAVFCLLWVVGEYIRNKPVITEYCLVNI